MHFNSGLLVLKRLDVYIISKFLGTYFFSIVLILSIGIVFDLTEKLDDFYNPHHEAVLRMIELVVKNAHKEGIWAGICGELGADTTLTERFVNMGVDELSVSPTFVLPIREKIRAME